MRETTVRRQLLASRGLEETNVGAVEPLTAATVQVMPPGDDEVLTSAEVARLLRISERKVQQMADSGRLPHLRLASESGKRVRYRFSRQAVLATLRGEQAQQPPPGA
jgi:excisionase family DNA binding protein